LATAAILKIVEVLKPLGVRLSHLPFFSLKFFGSRKRFLLKDTSNYKRYRIYPMADLFFTKNADVKMAVLEEKLSVYEDLSREMLAKLENAVDKISEANQNISKILVRHEERIDQTLQSDAAIIKLLDEAKKQNTDNFRAMDSTLKDHDKRIGDLAKFRWMIVGAVLLAGFIVGEMRPVSEVFNYGTRPNPVRQNQAF